MTHHVEQPPSPTRDQIAEWLTRPFAPPQACPIDEMLLAAGVDVDPTKADLGDTDDAAGNTAPVALHAIRGRVGG